MPIFRSTKNILKNVNEDEIFNPNWMDSNTLILPPRTFWDYSRELKIEDIDIWEVISEGYNNCSVYASWSPYAEFYMIVIGPNPQSALIETFYAKNANKKLIKKMKKLGLPINLNKIWVDNDKMWLYE
jgi:hypothetical protein